MTPYLWENWPRSPTNDIARWAGLRACCNTFIRPREALVDQLLPWLRENWMLIVTAQIILLVLFRGDRDGIRSVRDSVRSLHDGIVRGIAGQERYLHNLSDLSRLSAIESSLRRVEALMEASEKRERERERQKRARGERLKLQDDPFLARRLQELKHFVEHNCGGCVDADIPSEVLFSLPIDNNEALIEQLDDFVGTTGETVMIQATGGPAGSVRPAMLGRCFIIDLLSPLDDDELDRITCLRTSAWPGPARTKRSSAAT